MALRLVLVWTVVAVSVQAGLSFLLLNLPLTSPFVPIRELVTPLAVCAGPAGQWLALRICRVSWRREWFVATLAAAVLWSVTYDAVRYLKILPPGIVGTLLYTWLMTTALSAVLQFVVLRRHVDDAGWWLLAAATTLALRLATRWLFVGGGVFGAVRPTLTAQVVTALVAALAESVFLAWFISSTRDERPRDVSRSPAWTWLEWTAAAAFAVLTVVHCAQAVEFWLRHGNLLLAPPIFAAVGGTVIGSVQWLLLKRRLGISAMWIAVSAGAITVPALGVLVPGVQIFAVYIWVFGMALPGVFALVGAWFGFWQWLILRVHVSHAWLWIPANALAWSTWQLRLFPTIVSITTMGVVSGAITGLALFAMLRSRALAARLG
jgi:hypothetical protein